MNNSSSSIGFVGVLTIVFIILKLVGTISWSWFWVLSPMIFSISLGIVVLIIVLIVAFIMALINE